MHTIKAIILLLCLTLCHSRKNGSGKILGGRLAVAGEFPYVVSFSSPYICTGTLISYKQVMTSGRCFYDTHGILIKFWSKIDVIGGSLELGSLSEKPTDPKAQVRKLSSVVFARGFNDKQLIGVQYHDLAFAQVSKPFVKSDTLSLAKLPGRTADDVECKWHELAKYGKLQCLLVGWGTTRVDADFHADRPSKYLKVAEVKAWTDCKCKDELKKTKGEEDGTLHGEVCLEPVRKGEHTCEGDQGAPIICEGLVFGVISTTHCYIEGDYSDHRQFMDKQYGVLLWNYFDNVELQPIKANSFRLRFNLFALPIASLFFLT